MNDEIKKNFIQQSTKEERDLFERCATMTGGRLRRNSGCKVKLFFYLNNPATNKLDKKNKEIIQLEIFGDHFNGHFDVSKYKC